MSLLRGEVHRNQYEQSINFQTKIIRIIYLYKYGERIVKLRVLRDLIGTICCKLFYKAKVTKFLRSNKVTVALRSYER